MFTFKGAYDARGRALIYSNPATSRGVAFTSKEATSKAAKKDILDQIRRHVRRPVPPAFGAKELAKQEARRG